MTSGQPTNRLLGTIGLTVVLIGLWMAGQVRERLRTESHSRGWRHQLMRKPLGHSGPTHDATRESDAPRQLIEAALDSYREEYRELWETWRRVDSKAQGTVAIAGIFLAAVFAFVQTLSVTTPVESALLVIAVALLVLAVLISVLVLRVREVPMAPLGDTLDQLVQDLIHGHDRPGSAEVVGFLRDQTPLWSEANDELHTLGLKKANQLATAQLLLLIAALAVATLTVLRIL
jgi:Flp pilus assembly protein TadB